MKNVLIIGAGGFGREVFAWCRADPGYGKTWQIRGFLDDNPNALDGFTVHARIVGKVSDYQAAPDEECICAIGHPGTKKRIVELLLARGAVFRSLIHPSVVMGSMVTLGQGVVLCPGVVLTSHLVVGDFVMFNCLSSAGHDVQVGRFATISGHCDLTGFVEVGEGVFMGSRASIIPGRKIGAGATVGAGSVVITNVAPATTVFGNPARRIS